MRGHRMTDQEYRQWQTNEEDAAYAQYREIEKVLYDHFMALDAHSQEMTQQELTQKNLIDVFSKSIYLVSITKK